MAWLRRWPLCLLPSLSSWRVQDGNVLNIETHGEIITALILITTHLTFYRPDPHYTSSLTSTQKHPLLDKPTCPQDRQIWSLLSFLEMLLHGDDYKTVLDFLPSHSREGKIKSFWNMFGDSCVYVNHCIRVRDSGTISQEAILYAIIIYTDSCGVDLLIPVTFWGTTLCPDNITAVLIQVKTNLHFAHNVQMPVFDVMDSVRIGLFTDTANILLVICMVFVLGSVQPVVHVPAHTTLPAPMLPAHTNHDAYTTFDIWCAGCCNKSFKVISPAESTAYQSLLNQVRKGNFANRVHRARGSHQIEVEEAFKMSIEAAHCAMNSWAITTHFE
ncbi:uncharacterized protein PHACADRAFT_27981 [Phanerochaete carnosa HHB-10118-sp]|uniref:Uncharacterized protein n=1 Tax=Phanerochaete carnosa (strain HHB-10118-sp) TaxID=650164 RepID=K5X3E8_PHACS|nr:uncharacterized protein PHACADRAFT_27981 [Phanerochaete carnosa HHB-10118-sp]EKM57307.1 hypothetical protein PHACADRAFT_27981 [Phanerochaete carnosa HHB-10118-sp]